MTVQLNKLATFELQLELNINVCVMHLCFWLFRGGAFELGFHFQC